MFIRIREIIRVNVNFGLPLPSTSQFLHGVVGTENN